MEERHDAAATLGGFREVWAAPLIWIKRATEAFLQL